MDINVACGVRAAVCSSLVLGPLDTYSEHAILCTKVQRHEDTISDTVLGVINNRWLCKSTPWRRRVPCGRW